MLVLPSPSKCQSFCNVANNEKLTSSLVIGERPTISLTTVDVWQTNAVNGKHMATPNFCPLKQQSTELRWTIGQDWEVQVSTNDAPHTNSMQFYSNRKSLANRRNSTTAPRPYRTQTRSPKPNPNRAALIPRRRPPRRPNHQHRPHVNQSKIRTLTCLDQGPFPA